MLSHEVMRQLSEFLGSLNKPEFMGLIETCMANRKHMEVWLIDLIRDDKKGSQVKAAGELKHIIVQNISIALKGISSRRIYAQLEALREEILRLIPPTTEDLEDHPFYVLLTSIEVLIVRYESFIHNSSIENTLFLLQIGDYVGERLHAYRRLSSWVNERLEPVVMQRSEYEELSILLSMTTSYDEVVLKLTALGEIYSELCNLMGVSTSDYKLEVRKIESGSLWVSVFGHSRVVGFIISLIKSAIGFIHRNYTREGKIASIPRELEVADHILQFTKKAQEAGLDVSASKENVQKALFNISSKLNDFVADQPSVEVNGEVYSVGQAQEEKFLQETKTLLLEDGSQDNQ